MPHSCTGDVYGLRRAHCDSHSSDAHSVPALAHALRGTCACQADVLLLRGNAAASGMQGDNLRCSHGKCIKKAYRKPRKPHKPRAPKVPKKGEACGDLDWPCCARDGPEGARRLQARLLPA